MTTPICLRSSSGSQSRTSTPSMVMPAAGDVVEAGDQVDQGALARAGGAQQGHLLPRFDIES